MSSTTWTLFFPWKSSDPAPSNHPGGNDLHCSNRRFGWNPFRPWSLLVRTFRRAIYIFHTISTLGNRRLCDGMRPAPTTSPPKVSPPSWTAAAAAATMLVDAHSCCRSFSRKTEVPGPGRISDNSGLSVGMGPLRRRPVWCFQRRRRQRGDAMCNLCTHQLVLGWYLPSCTKRSEHGLCTSKQTTTSNGRHSSASRGWEKSCESGLIYSFYNPQLRHKFAFLETFASEVLGEGMLEASWRMQVDIYATQLYLTVDSEISYLR